MRTVLGCAILIAPLMGVVHAQTLRCESPDGKVSYSNGACPDGSSAVRTLPPTDPPRPADAKAASERLKADRQRVEAIQRQRDAEDKERARRLAADARAREKREAACRKLAQQRSDAESDVGRAALNQREAAERRAQKARARYAQDCPA